MSRHLGIKLVLPLAFACTLAVADEPKKAAPAPEAQAPAVECELATTVAPATTADVVVIDPNGDAAAELTASSCCDPALEPGTNGNPFCFEGHTCCASGQWQCNNADGTPSCTACGATCGLSGAACNVNADCCSNKCKANHRCR